MINHVLHTDGFYFATDYDLTHTLQRLANTSPEFQEMSLLERVRYTSHTLYIQSSVSVEVNDQSEMLSAIKSHLNARK